MLFEKAYLTGYSIAWSDELEIDILSVYVELSGKKPEEALRSSTLYASNQLVKPETEPSKILGARSRQ